MGFYKGRWSIISICDIEVENGLRINEGGRGRLAVFQTIFIVSLLNYCHVNFI